MNPVDAVASKSRVGRYLTNPVGNAVADKTGATGDIEGKMRTSDPVKKTISGLSI